MPETDAIRNKTSPSAAIVPVVAVIVFRSSVGMGRMVLAFDVENHRFANRRGGPGLLFERADPDLWVAGMNKLNDGTEQGHRVYRVPATGK